MSATVRLVDGRGCWTVVPWSGVVTRDAPGHHHVARPATAGDNVVWLPGQTWAGLPFFLSGDSDAEGREVYYAIEPAIGPVGPYIERLHKPDGWSGPQ